MQTMDARCKIDDMIKQLKSAEKTIHDLPIGTDEYEYKLSEACLNLRSIRRLLKDALSFLDEEE